MKQWIKGNKILYPIFHVGKAALYWFWATMAEILFLNRRYLSLKGMLKEDERFGHIKELKDKHKGKRGFIVATGPSLTFSDLEALKNEITISMNSMINVLGQTDYRPTYYMMQDIGVLHYDNAHNKLKLLNPKTVYVGIGNLGNRARSSFTISRLKKKPAARQWRFYHLDTAAHWFHINFRHENYKPQFSEDCNFRIIDGCTITYSALQMAVYMGFSEIYLVGVDCNYQGKIKHFGEYGPSPELDKADEIQTKMARSYEMAYEHAKKRGIKIYNATRGGTLEVFPRVSLDTLLERRRG